MIDFLAGNWLLTIQHGAACRPCTGRRVTVGYGHNNHLRIFTASVDPTLGYFNEKVLGSLTYL
ncbi:MAG: hypothetical protein WBY88_06760, partial [Desulfosarcina sp.]